MGGRMREKGKADRGDPGMLRKNITITPEQAAFLLRHPEINQSALFRQVVDGLMQAERAPGPSSARPLRLGRAIYRSGAVMLSPDRKEKD